MPGLRARHWKRTWDLSPDQCVSQKVMDSLGGETVA